MIFIVVMGFIGVIVALLFPSFFRRTLAGFAIVGIVWYLKPSLMDEDPFLVGLVVAVIIWTFSALMHMAQSSEQPVKKNRKCPYCAETILSEAVLCRYCNQKVYPSIAASETELKLEHDVYCQLCNTRQEPDESEIREQFMNCRECQQPIQL